MHTELPLIQIRRRLDFHVTGEESRARGSPRCPAVDHNLLRTVQTCGGADIRFPGRGFASRDKEETSQHVEESGQSQMSPYSVFKGGREK